MGTMGSWKGLQKITAFEKGGKKILEVSNGSKPLPLEKGAAKSMRSANIYFSGTGRAA